MERLYLETSGGTISYLERKGDFPVIFLHGLGGSGNNWLKLSQFLPEKYRMLMPDLAGHGKSTFAISEHSVREQTELLRLFVEALHLDRYALVGNSYGGWVAMRFSATIASPSALVLVDSAGINPTVGENSEEGVVKFVDRVMKMNSKNNRDTILKFVRKNSDGLEKLNHVELSRLPRRTLIIWGARDRLIPLEYARKLNNLIPGSDLKILDNSGHTPHATDPEKVAQAILQFLES